jgi:hypothetical protein
MGSRTEHLRRGRRFVLCCAVLAALAIARAQQGDGAKPDFSGTWTLDRNLSTNPAQITFVPAPDANRRPQRGGIGGFGGFGRGGSRPRADSQNSAESLTPSEQERLKALTDQLKTATATLVISHHDPDFVVNDAQDHTLFLHTTGEREENHLGAITISSSTHWTGSRLVTECVLGSRLTLVYTYTLLPNTRQLVVRVARQAEDRRPAGQDVRLVYRPEQK